MVYINGRTAVSFNFSKLNCGGPQKAIKSSANDSVILKPKIEVRGVFKRLNFWSSHFMNLLSLDLAALNAEIIVRCHEDKNKSFQLLGEIYKKQNQWAVGSDINPINESIKKIGLDSGLGNDKMDSCLKNENTQDQILNERIEAQKKYKIQSTPTIYINKKKYDGEHKYKQFKKAIEKLL